MTNERRQRIEAVLSKRQTNLTVVMENVFDPHNISAVLRSCDSVGIQDIYVLNTRHPRQAQWGYRSSGGAYKWVTVHQFSSVEECVREVRKNYSRILTTHLSSDAVSLYDVDFTESIALVFGNEQKGVSDELRALADGNFVIPQVGMIRSLNISVACAVSLYEAFRQKKQAGHYEQQQLASEQYNTLIKQWGVENEPN